MSTPDLSDRGGELRRNLDALTRRLAATYPELTHAAVAGTVAACAARLDDATVTDFVPLLVERDARRKLRQVDRERRREGIAAVVEPDDDLSRSCGTRTAPAGAAREGATPNVVRRRVAGVNRTALTPGR
jgi:hypothetical protein